MTLEEKFNNQSLGDRLSTPTYSELDQIARQFKRERDQLRAETERLRKENEALMAVVKAANDMETCCHLDDAADSEKKLLEALTAAREAGVNL